MGESSRPKPTAVSFEIPDLELELPSRGGQSAPLSAHTARHGSARGHSAPNSFDEDSFDASGPLNLELGTEAAPGIIDFGGAIEFDASGGFELEPAARSLAWDSGPASAVPRRAGLTAEDSVKWPTGRAPNAETLAIDPVEIAVLADYGAAPQNPLLTPAYAYRVFTRQRALKAELAARCAQRDRAELERESLLAELTRALRPAAEQMDGFRRFFAPIIELEQVASQRGQALATVNAELREQSSTFDAELSQIADLRAAEQGREQAALQAHGEGELRAQRAEAKLKRVHIEIRAVTQVAMQKLGPEGGQIPELEASQLVTLRQRVEAMMPEVTRAKLELEQASQALAQAQNKLDALRQAERATTRKKQALTDRFQKEVQVRSAGLSESEAQERALLAEGGRALLASRGALPIDSSWLERVRKVSERADRLVVQCEMLRRALDAYDRARVRHGIHLAGTALILMILLLVLKLAL